MLPVHPRQSSWLQVGRAGLEDQEGQAQHMVGMEQEDKEDMVGDNIEAVVVGSVLLLML
jgi:hypothetical protein